VTDARVSHNKRGGMHLLWRSKFTRSPIGVHSSKV
jgi:hypothetical protein